MKHKKIYKLKIPETDMIKGREMNLKKRDKKGDMEWKIVMFVVAALGLVLLVLIATKGLGWFSDVLGLLPGGISNQITKCKQLVGDNNFLDDAYCEVVEKVKTSKGKRAINCELDEIRLETKQSNPKICESRELSYCNGKELQVNEDEKLWKPEEEKINDYTCVQVFDKTFVPPPVTPPTPPNGDDETCGSFGGTWAKSCTLSGQVYTDVTIDVTDKSDMPSDKTKCCIFS